MSPKHRRLFSSWRPGIVGLGDNQRHWELGDHDYRQHWGSAAPPNPQPWAENQIEGFELQLFSALLSENREMTSTFWVSLANIWEWTDLHLPVVVSHTLGTMSSDDRADDVISAWLGSQCGLHPGCSDAKSVSIASSLYNSRNQTIHLRKN